VWFGEWIPCRGRPGNLNGPWYGSCLGLSELVLGLSVNNLGLRHSVVHLYPRTNSSATHLQTLYTRAWNPRQIGRVNLVPRLRLRNQVRARLPRIPKLPGRSSTYSTTVRAVTSKFSYSIITCVCNNKIYIEYYYATTVQISVLVEDQRYYYY
jgi:hypothetical protein